MERKRVAEMSKGAGRPKVGGEFKLVDHEGRPFGDGDMKGGFSLVSAVLSAALRIKGVHMNQNNHA